MKKNLLILLVMLLVLAGVGWFFATRDDIAQLTDAQSVGREPVFTPQRQETFPTVETAKAVGWKGGEAPRPAAGLTVERFADALSHPRSMLRLPNGDLLVAETNSPPRPTNGITDRIQNALMKRVGAGDPSPNRIILLRDTNGDGKADVKTTFLSGLNSPYGMALVGKTLYVANTDALMAFPYTEGATKIDGKGRKIVRLPADAPNMHWTRNLIASPDGKLLYVAVGANSNVAENGLDAEINRAAIIEINPANGDNRVFASGLRNPVGMAWEPKNGTLWAVVNERDMLGSDLVPDYLTRVEFGAFYGWPWNYWGGYEDKRVQPARPEVREYTKRPDFSLGNHVAPLGLTFSTGAKLGNTFANGAFVGLHGSWNRSPLSGYKVVFVPFDATGRPTGKPLDVLTGFVDAQQQARGRPVDVVVNGDGSLLVSDDVGGVIWRVRAR
ncbi:PQQ-dependent sugar dehydrogenase [Sphingobium subterraneum]|uniref:Glucose/arabinose dehydrogenase n=1 Tax=Sphingobium subterraneum TaxID=627688 RepID=A0A841IXN6_9SPHN|nr:sorbosone dehydrogenase family protein [Sphingobium subterraneum]MBB6123134.1 glucose/arabinose dehydrogenase [Sphingobium subterraneum]